MGMSWGLRRSTFFCCEDVHPISHRYAHLSNLSFAIFHGMERTLLKDEIISSNINDPVTFNCRRIFEYT